EWAWLRDLGYCLSAGRVILNQKVDYYARTGPCVCGHFRPDSAGDPRPAQARAGPCHRRGRALRDVAGRDLQARADTRARRAGPARAPGARAHADARRATTSPRRSVDVPLRTVLERAPRSSRGLLCAERMYQMKTFDFTVSRTIRGAADEVFDAWL